MSPCICWKAEKRKFGRSSNSRWMLSLSFIRRSDYSCAGIWESESRQALSLRRRHTQHSPSVELGAHSPVHTVHRTVLRRRSASIDRLASSRSFSGMTVSGRRTSGAVRGAGMRFRFTTPLYQAGCYHSLSRVKSKVGPDSLSFPRSRFPVCRYGENPCRFLS
jgi:hypothetical protein